jgi:thiamine biosynthesis protein ThiS
MSAMIEVYVNGVGRPLTEGTTVAVLVTDLGLPPKATLVERNEVALHRSEWETTVIEANDRIEFIRVAAGG